MVFVRMGLKRGFWAGLGVVMLVFRKEMKKKQIILRVFFKEKHF